MWIEKMMLSFIILLPVALTISAPGQQKLSKFINQKNDVISELLKDDGSYPNNPKCPLLVYKNAFHLPDDNAALVIEEVFQANGWSGSWRNGIFSFHHYHSNTHEVLGCYSGSVKAQFGGPQGVTMTLERGDVVIIPAGVSHKNLGSSGDFRVVGAYPSGKNWDMNRGDPDERQQAIESIEKVSLPAADPVYGKDGPLFEHWEK